MIVHSLTAKIDEQIERTLHLIALVPADRLQWRPPISGAWTTGEVLGHLLDCLAGFCAALQAAYPAPLAHFSALRELPVNRTCAPEDAREYIAVYRTHIAEGLDLLTGQDLARSLPTVFVPEGETLTTLLLDNLEHLINHKHQLFTYLRLMGVDASSRDLYRFR